MNITYLTFGGHLELHSYRYLYFVIMSTAYVLIICSNFTIVSLIVIHKNLHEPMYILIAALLMNSVFFSTNIYPKLLSDFLSEKQIISYSACLFQVFVFYSLSCSEFLLLAAMSYDRYVSICKPLQYPTIMKKTRLQFLLVFAWFLPACQTAVPIALNANNKLCRYILEGIFCNNSAIHLYCETSRALSIYGLVVLLNLVLFSMLFIFFTYTKILIISYQRCGEIRKKAAQTCLPHLLVLINYSCLIIYDIIIVRLESDLPKTARFIMTLQIIMYNPLFNPIIYGLKMKEISKHLKRLFCEHKVK
ncbi:olfactory receptor 6N2-like [Channa argus]|uniref:olfactory receptor 6N2-like n=1 Tax=Channa argus TaxID=215402 RepID=UPI0035220E2E